MEILKAQTVKAHGIHPSLEKLIYLSEGEFKFFKGLRARFVKRAEKFLRKLQGVKKESSKRIVERRSLTIEKDVRPLEGSVYQKESIYWRWQRVREYYRAITLTERYEKLVKEIKT